MCFFQGKWVLENTFSKLVEGVAAGKLHSRHHIVFVPKEQRNNYKI